MVHPLVGLKNYRPVVQLIAILHRVTLRNQLRAWVFPDWLPGFFHIFTLFAVMSHVSKISKFIFGEAINLSVGYLAGLTASNLVSKFFVKKGLVNLWGLAAKRDALNKDDYSWLMFGASYFIGLVVMLAVDYGMKKIRKTEGAVA